MLGKRCPRGRLVFIFYPHLLLQVCLRLFCHPKGEAGLSALALEIPDKPGPLAQAGNRMGLEPAGRVSLILRVNWNQSLRERKVFSACLSRLCGVKGLGRLN